MKKFFTILGLIVIMNVQESSAQLTPALVNNIDITRDGSSKFKMTWDVAINETLSNFEIEESKNGIDFKSIAVLVATEKKGSESYGYSGNVTNSDRIMYRLKIINKTQRVSYSKILICQAVSSPDNTIKILGNPVKNRLSFIYSATMLHSAQVKIFSISGIPVSVFNIKSNEINKVLTIDLNSVLNPGLYIIEVNNGIQTYSSKFMKQ